MFFYYVSDNTGDVPVNHSIITQNLILDVSSSSLPHNVMNQEILEVNRISNCSPILIGKGKSKHK